MRSASGVTTMMQRPVGTSLSVDARPELHADRQQVVAEHLAEVVVADLADVRRRAAEAGDAAHRVGGRAAAHLDRRPERLVQLDGPVGVDQVHPALHQAVLDEELVGGVGDHVDQGVADADHVEAGVAGQHLLTPDRHRPARYRFARPRSSRPRQYRFANRDMPPTPCSPTPSIRTASRATRTPTRYDLVLEPDLAAATFRGDGRRSPSPRPRPPTELVLNAIELEIDACAVDGAAGDVAARRGTERLFVTPARTVGRRRAHARRSTFRGTLNDQLRGWYRSTYRDDDGVEQVIATTQMQSTDCRRAFPCWDEPDFKAVFGVTLVVDPAHLAVSNGPEVERTSGRRRHASRCASPTRCR